MTTFKKKRPYMICLIGMDGSGKTSQALALSKYLNDNGINNEYVWGRWDPIIFKPIIRIAQKILFYKNDMNKDYSKYKNKKKSFLKNKLTSNLWAYSLLFDYFIKIFKDIKIPLLKRKIVICDRYIYDSVIDLAVDLDYDNKKIKKIIDFSLLIIPTPDIVILIDLPEEIAFGRKDDVPSLEYLKDRRCRYLDLGKIYKIQIIDGDRNFTQIQQEIKDNLL